LKHHGRLSLLRQRQILTLKVEEELNPVGAIVDTLHLRPEELKMIMGEYPDAEILAPANSNHLIQQVRVIIPSDDWTEDDYYLFLIDKSIAMSSTNFCSRVGSDPVFVARIRALMAEAGAPGTLAVTGSR
jgi:hypothetical protein